MNDSTKRPLPVADDLSRPFWDAAKNHRLVVQCCSSCGYYNHPPRSFCDACLASGLRFEPVSGRGLIYTYTTMHQRDVPGFEESAPFANMVVELVEQPMLFMVANVNDTDRDKLRIGAQVEVYFEDRGETVVPQFRIV